MLHASAVVPIEGLQVNPEVNPDNNRLIRKARRLARAHGMIINISSN